jgi:hypothetical protein
MFAHEAQGNPVWQHAEARPVARLGKPEMAADFNRKHLLVNQAHALNMTNDGILAVAECCRDFRRLFSGDQGTLIQTDKKTIHCNSIAKDIKRYNSLPVQTPDTGKPSLMVATMRESHTHAGNAVSSWPALQTAHLLFNSSNNNHNQLNTKACNPHAY